MWLQSYFFFHLLAWDAAYYGGKQNKNSYNLLVEDSVDSVFIWDEGTEEGKKREWREKEKEKQKRKEEGISFRPNQIYVLLVLAFQMKKAKQQIPNNF